MIIQVDQEGKVVIEQLCDIALKQGGVHNLRQVNMIFSSVKLFPVPKVEEKLKLKSPSEEDESVDQTKEIEEKKESKEE